MRNSAPTILFGAGGVLVEVFQDRALGLPPLNRTLARRLIERTQIFKALQGIRGQKAVPLDQLETLLVRFSYLLCDFLDIQEIDINPLLAGPDGLLALDARVLLVPAGQPKARLTIEPYPNQHTTRLDAQGRHADRRPGDSFRGRAIDHRLAQHPVGAVDPHAILQHGQDVVTRQPDPAMPSGLRA